MWLLIFWKRTTRQAYLPFVGWSFMLSNISFTKYLFELRRPIASFSIQNILLGIFCSIKVKQLFFFAL